MDTLLVWIKEALTTYTLIGMVVAILFGLFANLLADRALMWLNKLIKSAQKKNRYVIIHTEKGDFRIEVSPNMSIEEAAKIANKIIADGKAEEVKEIYK